MHPTFSATLADQHRAALRDQADHIRQRRASRPNDRPGRPLLRRWWRPATRPAQA
jgi:hypothetical protein